MSDASPSDNNLAGLIEELVSLIIELRRWEEDKSERSDKMIEEIRQRVEVVKAAINASTSRP